MPRNYEVSTRIARPVADVYDAIVSSDRLNRYFTNRTSGDLREGSRIIWHWDQWGDNGVTVRTLEPPRRIVLALDTQDWQKTQDDSYEVLVVFELEELDDGGTKLTISEEGWKTDEAGLKASHENCSGWTHMGMCLKGYIEHGLDLR
jgi:uncharacterized protein YndB with AHSA1/START domain